MSEPLVSSALASWISSRQAHRARRTDWAVVSVTGDDATKFLHNQLTHDVQLLPPGGARWTALCSAKGRVIASMLLVKHTTDRIELVVMADIAEVLVKRLKMFVLRAKVTLAVEPDRAAWTVASAEPLATPLWASAAVADDQTAVTLLPAGTLHRAAVVGAATDAPQADAAALQTAQSHDIESVWAWIGAVATDQHVPQMLNYESIDGISFKKGCYPGQEVVARSQFRGAIKRRTYAAHAPQAPALGDAVWTSAQEGDLEVGVVLQQAGKWVSLVLQQTAAESILVQANACWVASESEKKGLLLQALPYRLRADL